METSTSVPNWPVCRLKLTTQPFLSLGLYLLTRCSQISSLYPFVSHSIWHRLLDAISNTIFANSYKIKFLVQTKPWIMYLTIYKSSFMININQCVKMYNSDTTHTQAHTISNVRYQIRHHCVLTNTLLLCQVVSSFFHWNFKDRRENRWRKDFLSYSLHCKMMHWLYLWADITSLS